MKPMILGLTGAALALGVAALAWSQPAAPALTPEQQQARSAAVMTALQEQRTRFASAPAATNADADTLYQFSMEGLSLPRIPMTAFRGEVVLLVNTASKCGFTPQYAGLQQIYTEYHARGFEVVGVPSGDFHEQELGSSEEIQQFCDLNFGLTFPMAAKADVIGDHRLPIYAWAQAKLGDSAVPRWNFHKILIGRDGRPIRAFPTPTRPESDEVRAAIEAALAQAS
ncbi:MAG TPA: glutathione peroxidase [Caulobacterales bacterium]|nr:glutathione peroxidase [Caulobacterales bacterium]